MLNNNSDANSMFKGAAQGAQVTHNDLEKAAKASQARLKIAKQLGSLAPTNPHGGAHFTPNGFGGPPQPGQPVQGFGAPQAPQPGPQQGMMPNLAGHPLPHIGPNYKGAILGALAQRGLNVGPQHVHAAIDKLGAMGRFSPGQVLLLKAHNGPLVGPKGAQTAHDIASAIVSSQHPQGQGFA